MLTISVMAWCLSCDDNGHHDAAPDASADGDTSSSADGDTSSSEDADDLTDTIEHQDSEADGTVERPLRPYRLLLHADGAGIERVEGIAELFIDFTEMLSGEGIVGPFDDHSLLLVEVDAAERDIDDEVPFQFDPVPSYDPTTQAAGTLVFVLKERTEAIEDRRYHLYFNVEPGSVEPPSFAPRVTLVEGEDEGQTCFTIEGGGGTLFYQQQAGGFSSIVDVAGNDWLGFNASPGSGAAGEYRGIPNAIYPESSFHPGSTDTTSVVVSQGPLKITIRSTTNDGLWECLWEIFADHTTMTMLYIGHDYWFLYEGTPGGVLEPDVDFMIRSDGSETLLSESWSGDLVGEEWVAFVDPVVERSLLIIHHEDDEHQELYRPMEGAMTVFGFGRSSAPLAGLMFTVPQRFSFGLSATLDHIGCAAIVESITTPPTVTVEGLDLLE